MEDLDKEVAIITQKSPKSHSKEPRVDFKSSEEKSSKTGSSQNQEGNKGDGEKDGQEANVGGNVDPLASISVFGAKGMQSKINLIPLFNIKSLLLRYNRTEEALEIEYMIGLSLLCSRRYVQATEAFKRVQAKILKNCKEPSRDDPEEMKESKTHKEMMKAASLEILIAE